MKRKQDTLDMLENLIKFGWKFLDTEAAEIYENKINEIVELVNSEE